MRQAKERKETARKQGKQEKARKNAKIDVDV